MKNFFLPIFLWVVGWVSGAFGDELFAQSELSAVELAYVEDVVGRFDAIDSIAVVGGGGVVPALLDLSDALVVSFSKEGAVVDEKRHTVFLGEPRDSILSFKNTFSLERFDLIFVCASGEFHEMLRLIYALQGVAHDQTVLIFSGVEKGPSHSAAWRRCVERGVIEETNSLDDGCGHLWKEGRYLFGRVFSE